MEGLFVAELRRAKSERGAPWINNFGKSIKLRQRKKKLNGHVTIGKRKQFLSLNIIVMVNLQSSRHVIR